MENIEIAGSGYAIAEHCISNHDLEKILDTNDEWITTRTGIKTRYVSSDENTSDLGYRAACQAIEKAKIEKSDIDLIIVGTITPDNITPSCACLIQDKLGLNEAKIMAFDISAACTGFVYAMQIATYMLSEYSCALVVGADVNSKLMDYEDRNTSILFGDGAGAVILKKTKSSKQIHHYAQSSGDHDGFLKGQGIQMAQPLVNANREVGFLKQNGSEVFRFAVKALEEAIVEVLKKADKNIDEIDYIIPHQANIRIIRNVAKRMKLPVEKFYTNLDVYGNTSGGSIPIAFAQAYEQGVIKAGMKIIMVGFGAGFTYAASYVEL
ncbi:3-oxoacyl-[acyl-carrier-protein] synthase-3 [Breznakia sp. PF5-3]|uniref:beta-ketoacyl-ACP synthase III n=1 Tax=unclassified Breznakia TaxID=2623764 RepID=UPI0024064A0F|nr:MULTISPECIES: beta-ketoacyl-ACP synthase III [unclassified Breznakia]MDL2276188.1 ketoacyl-ACP synthase III [Breznakia sp. OttesenSCG-928-G09]MDF9824709.1 3-oxoacyl-[acyl-carrier-protein] synthase-3 [Breznakia sp. PM6-1]MDF9835372.1 3-oxoacyl-[acyl-carrier-protein] synthase-3 [Breznakia sp. PF5-3]MDF9836971.1 3-oxoacyl-[acyl-carrier-protein] synthase-3 [Breznakia sp. PFB2-8]MDF9859607.1 3-oxoacyl-[acyl-carrier-protein] synthase-3 [Breznakia sp. PH5-24]